jgi:cytidylate kinase
MKKAKPENIRNITVSGRIGSGATTLAKNIAQKLHWEVMEGGDLFEKFHQKLGVHQAEASKRPDSFDIAFENRMKQLFKEKEHQVFQSHLAGFNAQGIKGIYKILIVCNDKQNRDQQTVRMNRLIKREKISLEEAKYDVLEREKQNLEKYRRLYADSDKT